MPEITITTALGVGVGAGVGVGDGVGAGSGVVLGVGVGLGVGTGAGVGLGDAGGVGAGSVVGDDALLPHPLSNSALRLAAISPAARERTWRDMNPPLSVTAPGRSHGQAACPSARFRDNTSG
jgi:hypothetical protein